ncbi:hypothetical protein NFC73_06420 [Pseudarthrobacter sp. RMG13]|uniref:Lipoprotein LpqB N-terminal domain-containing protein n=1 Tax=Pseudarthrobacter humi TaxID=2952523 RepID=A0ABT1LMN2_9MICC|nr:hypothetical protein [Pseudarthrobacter humi]MCP8999374.1 hypothetical protein [Pseudarthrobacter humi]
MNTAAGRTDRILIAIIAGIAVLVVISLAVVFSRGQPEALDESTPPGVVQQYSTAVIGSDTATANSYLTEAARSSCSGYRESGPLPSRVVLISSTERDNTAVVKVSLVTSSPGGPFGPSEYEAEDRFSLVKVEGKWMIDQAPYQLMSCSGTSPRP